MAGGRSPTPDGALAPGSRGSGVKQVPQLLVTATAGLTAGAEAAWATSALTEAFSRNWEHFPHAALCSLLPHPRNVCEVCTLSQFGRTDCLPDSNTLSSGETEEIWG